jgi:hypothetical protein
MWFSYGTAPTPETGTVILLFNLRRRTELVLKIADV